MVATARKLDDFTISFVPYQPVHPHIACVVPHMLSLQLERETVSRFLPVILGVTALVTATAYMATDEAYPQIIGRITYTA
jgi:hypothetical protein